jgi:hypothetical protein
MAVACQGGLQLCTRDYINRMLLRSRSLYACAGWGAVIGVKKLGRSCLLRFDLRSQAWVVECSMCHCVIVAFARDPQLEHGTGEVVDLGLSSRMLIRVRFFRGTLILIPAHRLRTSSRPSTDPARVLFLCLCPVVFSQCCKRRTAPSLGSCPCPLPPLANRDLPSRRPWMPRDIRSGPCRTSAQNI